MHEKRVGDWNCDSCGHENFASRSKCHRCDKKRKRTTEGDWECAECGDYQFARNERCRKCKKGVRPEKHECGVCCEETTHGLECRSFHFTCDECLRGDIKANGMDRVDKHGAVQCLFPECDDSYDPSLVSQHVDVKELIRIAKQHAERETVENMAKNAHKEDDMHLANIHYDRITNKILSLACPRCTAVFLDFTGCCALRCASCGCGFCAWCLEDCGTDAHKHVAHCEVKPPGADTFFGSQKEVTQAQEKLVKMKFDHYWRFVVDKTSRALLAPRLRGVAPGLE